MIEDKLAEQIAKNLPVKEAYRDLAHPAAEELGQTAGSVASLARTALRPIFSMQKAADLVMDRLDGWLAKRLKGIDPDDVVEPPANIAGPAMMGLTFTVDVPELRDMFVQLLATAMTSSTKSSAHPAFVEIIRQMSATEARVLSRLSGKSQFPVIYVTAHDPDTEVMAPPRDDQMDFPDATVLSITESSSVEDVASQLSLHWNGTRYARGLITFLDTFEEFSDDSPLVRELENLDRLGVLSLNPQHRLVGPGSLAWYHKVATCPKGLEMYREVEANAMRAGIAPGLARLTHFGERFTEVCVPTDAAQHDDED